MNLQFAFDKAAAAVYEGIAIEKIEAWYCQQGLKIHARYNEANGLEHKRGYDLIDTYGKRWEVKADRLAGTTGNVFLEHVALAHSQADYFLIFACGLTFILPRDAILELAGGPYNSVWGGDDKSVRGTLVPVAALQELAEIV
jgi:hypothetical protein